MYIKWIKLKKIIKSYYKRYTSNKTGVNINNYCVGNNLTKVQRGKFQSYKHKQQFILDCCMHSIVKSLSWYICHLLFCPSPLMQCTIPYFYFSWMTIYNYIICQGLQLHINDHLNSNNWKKKKTKINVTNNWL